jgi:hypothetical protein
VKVRHVRRDPRASIVVFDSEPPYRGIEVRAEAILSANGDSGVGLRIAARYVGAVEATAWAEPEDMLIRLEPGSLRAWDFADEYPSPDPAPPLSGTQ